jgi:hypothetical protein
VRERATTESLYLLDVYNKVKQLEHDVKEMKKVQRQILSELRA